MTLLLTIFAAITVTAVWYNRKNDDMRLGILCFLYWGASIMWLVDALFEYFEDGVDFFNQELSTVINDAFLGLAVIALGLVIWIVRLLISDPKGSVRRAIRKQASH